MSEDLSTVRVKALCTKGKEVYIPRMRFVDRAFLGVLFHI